MGNSGFLARLRRDERGNTLALVAAGVLPLIGVVGGGLDASRMYLAKSRLQQACDAAALAARKELAGSSITGGTIPSAIDNKARRYFDINFTPGMYGTQNSDFELAAGSATRMDGSASVEVPTTLMKVFNFDKIDIAVTCSADLNLPNIDVVLVLDQSGSMDGQRIADLKEAVLAFYDEVMAAKPANARVRIGVVPYSSAVRVGQVLYAKNPNFIANSWVYQTREAESETVVDQPAEPGGWELYSDGREWLPRDKSNLNSSNTSHYRWKTNDSGDDANCNAYDGTYNVSGEQWVIGNDDYYKNIWSDGNSNWRGACQGSVKRYRYKEGKPATYKQQWRYKHLSKTMDTSVFKTFAKTTTIGTGSKGGNTTSTWNGCIEERATVAATNFDPIPAGALDLDFELVPQAGNPDTQWKPMWPQITYNRTTGPDPQYYDSARSTRGFSCPTIARTLREYPLSGGMRNSDFENYINSFDANGGTIHDVGLIWGARFISPNGIFASDNATAPNGDPIARHIIFMTDGAMAPPPSHLVAHGNYDMDGRLAGFKSGGWSESELALIHNARLDALCTRIKNKNITIWTVAFELPLNAHTRGCATGNSRAFEANNKAQLVQKFRDIAGSIAELRLVQ